MAYKKVKKPLPPYRKEFKLVRELDADIIEFMEKSDETVVALVREAMRLLMEKRSRKKEEEENVIDLQKSINEQWLSNVMRKVLNEYDFSQAKPNAVAPGEDKTKKRKKLGFNGIKI